jgi:hypothetical protein
VDVGKPDFPIRTVRRISQIVANRPCTSLDRTSAGGRDREPGSHLRPYGFFSTMLLPKINPISATARTWFSFNPA